MTLKAGLEDYEWLVSREAQRWLEFAAKHATALVTAAGQLRQALDPQRTHLVLEQAELRQRAKAKFSQAERMFFTRRQLEQATDEQVARYKATRFCNLDSVADLCCGIGGDLLGLAEVANVLGLDKDPIVAMFAVENCVNCGHGEVQVQVGDVAELDVGNMSAWHIDPDRRAAATRTTDPAWGQPGIEAIERLLAANPNAAVKLAPAATAPESWLPTAELEWIESRGECRQQVAWFGRLTENPGRRCATVLAADGQFSTFLGEAGAENVSPPLADEMGRFLFEPAAAVLAAGLAGALAESLGLSPLLSGGGYLTGDIGPVSVSPLLARFEVHERMPFDLKRLTAYLREHRIGCGEIKKRGVDVKPETLKPRLPDSGDWLATLILLPFRGQVQVAVTRRWMN